MSKSLNRSRQDAGEANAGVHVEKWSRAAMYLRAHEYFLEQEARKFASSLPAGSRILDAGAGECLYRKLFEHCDYTSCDSGVGESSWDYSHLDIVCDLTDIPRPDGSFDACVCLVVLEHVREPWNVLRELYRVLDCGARFFAAVPFCVPEHQPPNDYFRFSSFGIRSLLETAGFDGIEVRPWGNTKLCTVHLLASAFSGRASGRIVDRVISRLVLWGVLPLKMLYFSWHGPDSKSMPFGWFVEARKGRRESGEQGLE